MPEMPDKVERNSSKLNLEAQRLSASEAIIPKESYKTIPEDIDHQHKVDVEGLENVISDSVKNSNMVREKVDMSEEGADEKMLGTGDEEQQNLAKKEEVKFISGDQQNGDAKIDIGTVDKTFTGMTKEELMKYANDPFWVRLRWFLFICFWGLWAGMLIGAVLIIIYAPKCAAPEPLSWWKQGPLVKIDTPTPDDSVVEAIRTLGVKGVIYEVPADETYNIASEPAISDALKKLAGAFTAFGINLIVDLTPNFVTRQDPLFQKAMNNPEARSAFVWREGNQVPNNWRSLVNGSAWTNEGGQIILQQFGPDRFDLQLKDPLALAKLKGVLKEVVGLGVKGIRLANTKHFIIDESLTDDGPSNNPYYDHTHYGFWTHAHTTYQEGLGELLYDLKAYVHNLTESQGFLAASDDIDRPEVYMSKNGLQSLDMIQLGRVPNLLANSTTADHLYRELRNVWESTVEAGKHFWLQWNYVKQEFLKHITISEYNIFLQLIPGVPVFNVDAPRAKPQDFSTETFHKIRTSPSYMHGSFDLYKDVNNTVIGYSRTKSGNPGFFVVLNPTEHHVDANFSNVVGIAEELTIHTTSSNYNVTDVAVKAKVLSSAIPVSGYSAMILTYVPKA
ncbi:maltase A3 isoform X2 [Phlebotomus papatasi]|uniref:maltase A3 isoform X2 n=1 Tax=Phlebotomus papatasi TaxID=29031 RepID=UPI0024841588|nr:maltase A3 isoform X2 [Phlebotomus papatasi]